MKYNVLLLLSCIFAASAAAAQPSAGVEPSVSLARTVSVSGEAKEEITPDRATLSGRIVSKDVKLEVAKAANDKLAEKALAVARQFDIPTEKIAASNVSVSPEYGTNQQDQREVVGYVVSRNLTITMDHMEIHEKLVAALVQSGIDQINSVNFTVGDTETRLNALRTRAVQNARARAEALASAAGAKLGRVVSISEDGATAPMPRMAMAMKGESSSVAPSLPGTETLWERVSVTFELE